MPKFLPSSPYRAHTGIESMNKDSAFISGVVKEQIERGGVNVYAWLLEGVIDQRDPTTGMSQEPLVDSLGEYDDDGVFQGIQDVILGENRDRKYSDDSVQLVGVYAVSQNELDFARFGLMLSNDIIQMEFHRQDMEKRVGRRLTVGDVLELPHLREVGFDGRIKSRFYEIQSIVKSPGGYDHTYYYHVLTCTIRPIRDSQEFIDLMEREDRYGNTLESQVSNRDELDNITGQIQEAAYDQAGTTWFDTNPIYVDEPTGKVTVWYEDATPPNGIPFTKVSAFPQNPTDDQYVVRVDFYPNRLYRYFQGKWIFVESDVKRNWAPYNWTKRLRQFMSDRSPDDVVRPWQLKSIHDVLTVRQDRSTPSPSDDES